MSPEQRSARSTFLKRLLILALAVIVTAVVVVVACNAIFKATQSIEENRAKNDISRWPQEVQQIILGDPLFESWVRSSSTTTSRGDQVTYIYISRAQRHTIDPKKGFAVRNSKGEEGVTFIFDTFGYTNGKLTYRDNYAEVVPANETQKIETRYKQAKDEAQAYYPANLFTPK